MESIYLEITIIICVAFAMSVLFRFFKQQSILAYILTEIILGPLGFYRFENNLTLSSLGGIGVTFLLFMLGLELKLKELKSIGPRAIVISSLQMWFTFAAGFLVSSWLGLDNLTSLYLGIAISFSSTVLVVKNLSDKKDLNSLHGKLSIGILLLQDFFAVMALVILSSVKTGELTTGFWWQIIVILIKAVIVFYIIVLLSIKVLPNVVRKLAVSSELLFLFSLAWMFAVTAFMASPFMAFSIEVGGFLAGLALANCPENYQIVSKMKTLRDFFITIFFVMLGLSINFSGIGNEIIPLFILLVIVIVFKPLLIMLLVNSVGYDKRPSFLTGNVMGQVSEFSFILLIMGRNSGYINDDIVTLIIALGVISYPISSYLIRHEAAVYKLFYPILSRFALQKKYAGIVDKTYEHLHNHLVIIGGHQMGQSIIHALEKIDDNYIVLDFDPDIVEKLEKLQIPVLFGDIADPEIQEKIRIDKAKLVISTIPDLEDNLMLLNGLRHKNKKARIIVAALENEDAKALYQAGADYVVLPHLAGGRYLAKLLKDDMILESLSWHRARDAEYIK